jgi:glutathione S-transferase
MPVLYNSMISGNCYKVLLLAAHLGIDLELREVSVTDRSDRPELLGSLNPALRVPTLVLDNGRPLGESGAILWYFGEDTRFVPADRYERAQVLQWMFFEQYETEPTLAVARFLIAYSGLDRKDYEKRLPRLHADGTKALGAMDRHMQDREWFVGSSPSLADIALYGYTHCCEEGGFELGPFEHVRGWLERVAGMPGHIAMDADPFGAGLLAT